MVSRSVRDGIRAQNRTLMIEAAKRYAAANNSDPFAYRRALTHLNNGIATYANEKGESGYYDAEEGTERRYLPDGTEYTATVYRNIARV